MEYMSELMQKKIKRNYEERSDHEKETMNEGTYKQYDYKQSHECQSSLDWDLGCLFQKSGLRRGISA